MSEKGKDELSEPPNDEDGGGKVEEPEQQAETEDDTKVAGEPSGADISDEGKLAEVAQLQQDEASYNDEGQNVDLEEPETQLEPEQLLDEGGGGQKHVQIREGSEHAEDLQDEQEVGGSLDLDEESMHSSYPQRQSVDTDGSFGDSDWLVVDDDTSLATSDDDQSETEVIEEQEEESLLEREIPLSQGDLKQISEEPARMELDKLAAHLAPRVDSKLLHFPFPRSDEDLPLPSDPKYTSSAEPVMERCPSRESFFRQKKRAYVQLYLHPGKKVISRDCRLDVTVSQLKSELSNLVGVPASYLDIRRKRHLVGDHKTLQDLGATAHGKMLLSMEVSRRVPKRVQISLPEDQEEIAPKSKTISVQVTDSNGATSKVPVTIEYSTVPKPKLGGIKDNRTGRRFVHATTMPDPIDAKQWELLDDHKGCQTLYSRQASVQTRVDIGQQMEREDYYVSRERDRTLRAKKYVTWEEVQKKKERAAVTIQRYWRGWLGRFERKQRLEAFVKRIEWMEKIRRGRVDSRLAIMNSEISRQECPSRLVDLELLYRAINKWRQEQEQYVMQNRWGAERKAALAILTEMEVNLLQDLERTRRRIQENGRERVADATFKTMGKPKRWLGRSDTFLVMDTKEREKVRKLHLIYRDMKAPVCGEGEERINGNLTLEERVKLLEKLNEMTKKLRNRTALMLNDLITREMTYIKINCSKALLLSLRKRMSNCFFLLCQDPIFNPESKRLQTVPFDQSKLKNDMVQCKGCRRMWYRDEFTIQRGTTVTSRCRMCMGLYRTAILRVDLNLYRHILDDLRKDELAAGVSDSVTFLIDAFDMQFLVEQIWHGQSALSGIDNKYLLQVCRWIKDQPWTPWNSVLLTEEEAGSHLQLDDLKSAYRSSFFHKVFVTQSAAKMHFQGLSKLSLNLDYGLFQKCTRYWDKEKKRLDREKIKKKIRTFATSRKS